MVPVAGFSVTGRNLPLRYLADHVIDVTEQVAVGGSLQPSPDASFQCTSSEFRAGNAHCHRHLQEHGSQAAGLLVESVEKSSGRAEWCGHGNPS